MKKPTRLPRPRTVSLTLEWTLLPWLRRKAKRGEAMGTTVRRLLVERMAEDYE